MNNAISRLRVFLGSLRGFVILKLVIQGVLMALGYICMMFQRGLFPLVFIAITLAIVSASSIIMTIARYSREKRNLSKNDRGMMIASLSVDISLLAGFMLYVMPHLLNPDLYDPFHRIRPR